MAEIFGRKWEGLPTYVQLPFNSKDEDVYNENVDVIQMVPPEEFIKTQKQKSAESDLE